MKIGSVIACYTDNDRHYALEFKQSINAILGQTEDVLLLYDKDQKGKLATILESVAKIKKYPVVLNKRAVASLDSLKGAEDTILRNLVTLDELSYSLDDGMAVKTTTGCETNLDYYKKLLKWQRLHIHNYRRSYSQISYDILTSA